MRKIWIFLISLLIAAPALSYPRPIQPGERYVFGSNVNMREKPDVSSRMITQLKIGTMVIVESRTDKVSTIDGLKDNWYRARAGNHSGYIWGALIADNAISGDIDSDGRQELVLVKNLTEGVYSTTTTGTSRLEIRIAAANSLISSCIIPASAKTAGNAAIPLGEITIKEIALKKLPGVDEAPTLLHMTYIFSNELSGKAEKIFSFKNNILIEAIDIIHASGEGGYGCRSDVIYPLAKGGMKNKIIIETTCRDYTDEKQRISERYKVMYTWDRGSGSFHHADTGN